MSEAKEIFQRLLDTPQPPLRDGGEVLAHAARSAQRRQTRLAVATGLAVVAVLLPLVGVVSDSGHVDTTNSATPVLTPTISPTTGEPTTAAAVPTNTWPQDFALLDRMQATLLKHIPAGYDVPSTDTAKGVNWNGETISYHPRGAQIRSMPDGSDAYTAFTELYLDGLVATLEVDTIVNGKSRLPMLADPCSAAGVAHQGLDTGCQTITTVGGLVARCTYRPAGDGNLYYASIAFADATVFVTQKFGSEELGPIPSSLYKQVFTTAQLAEIAADPGFRQ